MKRDGTKWHKIINTCLLGNCIAILAPKVWFIFGYYPGKPAEALFYATGAGGWVDP